MLKGLSQTVLRNSALAFAAQLALKVLSFAFTVLIVRRLGNEAYGQYAAIGAFVLVFLFLSDLGLSVFAVREVARWRDVDGGQDKINQLYGNMLSLRLTLAIISGLITVAAAALTGRPILFVGAVALYSLGILMYGVQGTSNAFLGGYERIGRSSRAQVINQIAFMVLGGLALWWGLGFYGLIFATLIGTAILTYVCWAGVRELGVKPSRPNIADWPGLIKASLPFGIVTFALGLSYRFDTVLLSVTRSDAEVAWYNVAYNLIFSCVMLSNVVNTALYPSLSRQSVAGAHVLPAIYERALRYLMMLAIPLSIGIFVLSPDLIPFLFKAENAPAALALQILIWVVPFMYASEFLGYIVLIAGQEKRVARSVVISTAFNVLVNLVVVPRYGYLAAAMMTVLTEMILVGQYFYILRAQLRNFHWGYVLLRPLLAALGMGLALWLSQGLPLWIHASIGALTYVAFLVALGVLGKDELHFVRNIRRPSPVTEPNAL